VATVTSTGLVAAKAAGTAQAGEGDRAEVGAGQTLISG
jgi:hypothetical protein